MVSIRCKMVVKSELKRLGLHFSSVDLGVVEIMENITAEQREDLRKGLRSSGLELMDDQKAVLIEKIKNIIIEMIHYADDETLNINIPNFLAERLNHNCTYLSAIFSEVTGTTIEHYIITHKIERVKELLLYDEFTLTEISYKLNYSSVAHLSSQFKKVTGLTPTFYRQLKDKRRNTLENPLGG